MSKKWTKMYFGTEPKKEESVDHKKKRIAAFEKAIKNTKSLSVEDLKKESDDLYKKTVAVEDSLLSALEAGKLKSEAAIKQANQIKKAREKKAVKKQPASTTV